MTLNAHSSISDTALDTTTPPAEPGTELNTEPGTGALTLTDLPRELTAPQAYELQKSGQAPLIDIRSPLEWMQSGVPEGAHLISVHEPGFLDKLLELLDHDKTRPFILICRTGNRTPYVMQALEQYGFTNMYEVPEGMSGSYRTPHAPGWPGHGLPVRPYNPYLMD